MFSKIHVLVIETIGLHGQAAPDHCMVISAVLHELFSCMRILTQDKVLATICYISSIALLLAAITTGCEILYDSRKLDTKLHMHKFKAIKSSVLTGH